MAHVKIGLSTPEVPVEDPGSSRRVSVRLPYPLLGPTRQQTIWFRAAKASKGETCSSLLRKKIDLDRCASTRPGTPAKASHVDGENDQTVSKSCTDKFRKHFSWRKLSFSRGLESLGRSSGDTFPTKSYRFDPTRALKQRVNISKFISGRLSGFKPPCPSVASGSKLLHATSGRTSRVTFIQDDSVSEHKVDNTKSLAVAYPTSMDSHHTGAGKHVVEDVGVDDIHFLQGSGTKGRYKKHDEHHDVGESKHRAVSKPRSAVRRQPKTLPPVEPKHSLPESESTSPESPQRRKSSGDQPATKQRAKKLPAIKKRGRRNTLAGPCDANSTEDPYNHIMQWLSTGGPYMRGRSRSPTNDELLGMHRPAIILGSVSEAKRPLPDLPDTTERRSSVCSRSEVDELAYKVETLQAKVSQQGCLKPIPYSGPSPEEIQRKQQELEEQREREAEEKKAAVLQRIQERRWRRSLGPEYIAEFFDKTFEDKDASEDTMDSPRESHSEPLKLSDLNFDHVKNRGLVRAAQALGLTAEETNDLYFTRDHKLLSGAFIDRLNKMAFGSDTEESGQHSDL